MIFNFIGFMYSGASNRLFLSTNDSFSLLYRKSNTHHFARIQNKVFYCLLCKGDMAGQREEGK